MHYKKRMWISTVEEIDVQYHRSPIIIHESGVGSFHFAEFETMEQLDFFARMLGFTYELVEERNWRNNTNNTYREYAISHKINSDYIGGFWTLSDIPADAKPFKALSNGSIVTCYFVNDSKEITIYRPNPNAKEVYKPLELKDHIAHKRIYGSY